MLSNQKWALCGGVCGVAAALVYFGLALSDPWLPGSAARTTAQALAEFARPENRRWILLPHFLMVPFPTLGIVALRALGRLLANHASGRGPTAAQVGTLFGVIGFSILVAMLLVQGTVMTEMGRAYADATTDAARENVVHLYRALRSIDVALDLAWDVFITLSISLVGWAMIAHPWFGKPLGVAGVLVGLAALAVNVWTAPTPPSFDFGPLGGLWFLAVSIQMLRLSRRPLD